MNKHNQNIFMIQLSVLKMLGKPWEVDSVQTFTKDSLKTSTKPSEKFLLWEISIILFGLSEFSSKKCTSSNSNETEFDFPIFKKNDFFSKSLSKYKSKNVKKFVSTSESFKITFFQLIYRMLKFSFKNINIVFVEKLKKILLPFKQS